HGRNGAVRGIAHCRSLPWRAAGGNCAPNPAGLACAPDAPCTDVVGTKPRSRTCDPGFVPGARNPDRKYGVPIGVDAMRRAVILGAIGVLLLAAALLLQRSLQRQDQFADT